MKTLVTIEIEHRRPIRRLADMVAARAWTIDGVKRAEVITSAVPVLEVEDLKRAGFTEEEIALGMTEVVR